MIERYPTELNMLETFGISPYAKQPKDGFWSYRFSNGQVTLLFSFNIFEQFIQTRLFVDDMLIDRVTHEGVQTISLINDRKIIIAKCIADAFAAELTIHLEDTIQITWNTLINTP
jgi:hypothetical protein